MHPLLRVETFCLLVCFAWAGKLRKELLVRGIEHLNSEVQFMCNLSKDVLERGYQKGYQEGFRIGVVFSLRNLMKNMTLTKEQAMEALGIPESDREEYTKELIKE